MKKETKGAMVVRLANEGKTIEEIVVLAKTTKASAQWYLSKAKVSATKTSENVLKTVKKEDTPLKKENTKIYEADIFDIDDAQRLIWLEATSKEEAERLAIRKHKAKIVNRIDISRFINMEEVEAFC